MASPNTIKLRELQPSEPKFLESMQPSKRHLAKKIRDYKKKHPQEIKKLEGDLIPHTI